MGSKYLGDHMLRLAMLAVAVLAGAVHSARPAAAQSTIEAIKKRGEVLCGVSGRSQGFSFVNDAKEWSGLDVEFCRAVAAAVLGDAKKVGFVAVSTSERLDKLRAGAFDLLASNVTLTLQRDAGLGLQVGVVNYYDGQAFAVARKSGISTLTAVSGHSICMAAGTTHIGNTTDWFQARGLKFTPVVLDNKDLMYEAFFAGKCNRGNGGLLRARGGHRRAGQCRRLCPVAGDHLQGAARPLFAPRRRCLARGGALDAVRPVRGRGTRRLPDHRRRRPEVEEPGRPAPARRHPG
jgi:hypothetical protein